jgi:hypothetical protein
MHDDTGLSLGQRLMFGLVIAPASVLMALGTLDSLSTHVHEWSAVEALVHWIYVLFLAGIGAATLTMAVTGRAPGVQGRS